ncbi:ectoine/hydroxyectoine ABC transporter permease subunit EhuD [Paenibacillus thiaminolyticus]|uniref:ectoine/hydroxyectoine ABC transporter permease subunit EhuD n=1 Tax=Paenibacillus thiaminolyticus TaxID=49283 RepID=UPI0011648B97|nr:ectoine/hydroxyectoine ABC transporter permease subunit EhuD [Paenibacillus thiaminolyticus]NGP58486.1 ectoine/hydroxyectoine ABC transporter permease subunit EhuD [Paenibacillus thiaminolyticus]WCF07650.1 ectoine/hydroxyectoine ABC transporter permease subunit EhuD [Paenibacillus thiaminolyticus]
MWSWDYALEILPQLLQVLPITIGATLLGFAAACMLGLPLALARRSRYRAVSVLANAWMEFIRSTPLLVQLFVLFYALPLYGISFSPFVTGVIGLGLHYSAYLSEVFRSGIEAVPAGQWEAAKALNFGRRHSWTNIILPQAIPPIIPVMGNYLITMFKETPVLSAITLVELLQTAKAIGSGSFRYLEAFTMVGLLFLLLSYPSSLLVSRLEKRFQNK